MALCYRCITCSAVAHRAQLRLRLACLASVLLDASPREQHASFTVQKAARRCGYGRLSAWRTEHNAYRRTDQRCAAARRHSSTPARCSQPQSTCREAHSTASMRAIRKIALGRAPRTPASLSSSASATRGATRGAASGASDADRHRSTIFDRRNVEFLLWEQPAFARGGTCSRTRRRSSKFFLVYLVCSCATPVF